MKYSIILVDYSKQYAYYGFMSWVFQAYGDYEIILLTCNDKTRYEEQINKFFRKHIIIKRLNKPKLFNLSAFRNLGAFYSKGEYLLFVGVDIVGLKSTLRTLQNLNISTPEVVGHSKFITDTKVLDACVLGQSFDEIIFNKGQKNREGFKNKNSYGAIKYIKREDFINIGGYNSNILFHDDAEFDRRLARQLTTNGNVELLNSKLFFKHIRPGREYATETHRAIIPTYIKNKNWNDLQNFDKGNVYELPKLNLNENFLMNKIYQER